MNIQDIKIGDTLKCIDGNRKELIMGREYIVTSKDYSYISVDSTKPGWLANRFEAIDNFKEELIEQFRIW